MAFGEPDALLVTVTDPLSLPAALGLKITSNIMFWPAFRVTGVLAPVKLKPLPVSVICETVTLEFPELVIVTLCVAEDPVLTFPKAMFAVLNVNV